MENDDFNKSRRAKNRVLLAVLLGICMLLYAVAVMRMGMPKP
jgi:hypothetical protein